MNTNEWKNRAETHNNSRLESIDVILANLKKDKDYYNHGMTEQAWMHEQNRDD